MLKELINRYKIQIIILGDILIFYISLFLMISIRFKGEVLSNYNKHLLPFSFLFLIWLTIFYISDLYSYNNLSSTIENKKKLFIAILINFIISLSIFYILVTIFYISPKTNLLIFTLIFLFLDYLYRHYFSYFLKQKYNNSKILLLSSSSLNDFLIKYFNENKEIGYSIEKIEEEDFLKRDFSKEKYLTIIFNNKYFSKKEIIKKLYYLISKKIEIISLEDFYEKMFGKMPLEELKEDWFINEIKLNYYFNDGIKNVFDKILAFFLLIIFSPLFLIISFLIKLTSKGEIFYKQKRVGKNNTEFKLFKFRTMYSEKWKNPDADGSTAIWAKENDKRITSMGKILRQSHLDELPQLINIIKGDISFIGPRPERKEFTEVLEKEIPHYLFRQIIKPGLTGYAQVKYKYTNTISESKEKFEYDLYYIKNRNIFLDVKIILQTIKLFF